MGIWRCERHERDPKGKKKEKYLKRGKKMDGVKVHVIACEYSYTPNLFIYLFLFYFIII